MLKELEEESTREREQCVQRPWGVEESDLFKEEEGARRLWGAECGTQPYAFVEGSMDFILSKIGSYLRVLSRQVT